MKDGTYGVKKGVNIANGMNIKIPAEYKGIAVTSILDNGFYNCDSIVKVEIPDTIARVGVGAFDGCDNIADFTVYVAHENETYETFYSSHDGALLYYDAASARTYLEIFPKAKTGTYTIPEGVQSGESFTLKGQGVSNINNPKRRGNIVFTVKVQTPKNLTSEQKKILKSFAESMGEDGAGSKRRSFFKDKFK